MSGLALVGQPDDLGDQKEHSLEVQEFAPRDPLVLVPTSPREPVLRLKIQDALLALSLHDLLGVVP